MQVFVYNLQRRNLTHLDKGLLGCSYGTVVRVVIYKYLNLVADLHIEFHKAIWQQHLNTLTISEI